MNDGVITITVDGDIFYCRDDNYKIDKTIMHKELHRENGPAVIALDGYVEYWLNGVEYSEEDYRVEVRKLKLEKIKELIK